MAAVVVESANQNTEQTGTDTTYVNVPGAQTGVLANGVDYLVFHGMSMASGTSSAEGFGRLVLGPSATDASTTEFNEGIGEGLGTGAFYAGGRCQGIARVTGNGTDVLKYQAHVSVGTWYAGAASIQAMSTAELTENTDFFWDETANTSTLTDLGTTMTDLLSTSFTLPDAGDYAVFMSVERGYDATAAAGEDAIVRAEVNSIAAPDSDATTYAENWWDEFEDDTVVDTWVLQTVQSLSAGSNTFAIRGRSADAANTTSWRRARILVIRLDSFDQYAVTSFAAGSANGQALTNDTTLTDLTNMDPSITPNQTEDVLCLAMIPWRATNSIAARMNLRDDSGGTNLVELSGYATHNNDAQSAQFLPALATSVPASVARDFKIQFQASAAFNIVAVGRNEADSAAAETHFLLLSMTVPDAASDQPAVQCGAVW